MGNTFFVSYRRSDSSEFASRFADALRKKAGKTAVFFDVHDIHAGEDWRTRINDTIRSSSVCFVIVGPKYASLFKRHLFGFSADDVLRFEVACALKMSANIVVVPVLQEGSALPRRGKLPPDLRALVDKQAYTVRTDQFDADFARLLEQLGTSFPRIRWGVTGDAPLKIIQKHLTALIGRIESRQVSSVTALRQQRGLFDPQAQADALSADVNLSAMECISELNLIPERLSRLSSAEQDYILELFHSLGNIENNLSTAVSSAQEGSGWKLAAKAFGLGVMGAGTGVVAGTAVPVIGNIVGGIAGFFGGIWAALSETQHEVLDEIVDRMTNSFDRLKNDVRIFRDSQALVAAASQLASGSIDKSSKGST